MTERRTRQRTIIKWNNIGIDNNEQMKERDKDRGMVKITRPKCNICIWCGLSNALLNTFQEIIIFKQLFALSFHFLFFSASTQQRRRNMTARISWVFCNFRNNVPFPFGLEAVLARHWLIFFPLSTHYKTFAFINHLTNKRHESSFAFHCLSTVRDATVNCLVQNENNVGYWTVSLIYNGISLKLSVHLHFN